MKTLTRTTLASVAVLSVLAGCAPAKRATNKPTAATNANPASASAIAPFQNTTVVNADAHLPTVPPTDTTVPAGTINLMTTTKGQPLVVNLDNSFNATTANNQLSNPTFKCTTVPAQATLDKCADGELDVTLTGTDNQAHAVQVLVSRRGQVNVDEKIIDPKNPSATGVPENPKFGQAFYQATLTSVDKTAFHVLEIAYITTPAAKSTDTPQGTGLIPVGPANQVAFYITGALVDTSGNPLTCAQTAKNATCGPDTTVSAIDSTSKNIVKSFIVQMSDKSLKTVLLTVQDRNTNPNAAPNGSTDTSTMISTVQAATNSGTNPAPANPTAPAANNPPATPAAPTNPAATSQAVGGSVSSSGGPAAMTQKPAAPAANPTAPANNNNNPAATGNSAGGGNTAAPANPQAPAPNAPETDASGNYPAPAGS